MYRNLIMALSICMASPVLAEEVLYCVDTDAIGFVWDKRGKASRSGFDPKRYTIKVVSNAERHIVDDTGFSAPYKCERYKDRLICDDIIGGTPWVFSGTTYTRAFLLGPPAGGGDQNIAVIYGTCTKF
jgi:hypothetical protein